jgi:nicotinamidase-related amidase
MAIQSSKKDLLRCLELDASNLGVCVLDVQEKLAAAMPDKVLKGTLRNWLNLIETARALQLPVLVSEQYSKGLGRTLPVVAESILRLPRDQVLFCDKMVFNACGCEKFSEWLGQQKRQQWLVIGMEAHICVFQTVRDLTIEQGYVVHVPRDAVISRTIANWEIGLQLIAQAGAVVTSTETVIFDLLKQAGTPSFKTLSKFIK